MRARGQSHHLHQHGVERANQTRGPDWTSNKSRVCSAAIKDDGLKEIEIKISIIPTQILYCDPATGTTPSP